MLKQRSTERRSRRRSGSKVKRHYNRLVQQVRGVAAALHRRRSDHVTYIGLTGSCGKTTTANLLDAVLSTAGESSLHADVNHFERMVSNVLSVGPDTAYCVQEVSGHRPGAVRSVTQVLRPNIGIVTNVGSDHYKLYRSLEATAKEKHTLIEDLPPDGIAILNVDDPHVRDMRGHTKARVVTFGTSEDADFRATQVSGAWPDTLAVTVAHGDRETCIKTKLVGETWTTSVLAAFACAVECGLDPKGAADAIAEFQPVSGRCSPHSLPNQSDFVLDNWKAPAWTIPNSLDFIRQARVPRKTIVFGTISDYPGGGSRRYRRIAREALEVANRVVFVGPQSGHVTKLPETGDRLFAFETAYQAAAFLGETAAPRELVLVKSSISDHLERLFLAQRDDVVCWKEGCHKIYNDCPGCPNYRKPSPPPFGLAR